MASTMDKINLIKIVMQDLEFGRTSEVEALMRIKLIILSFEITQDDITRIEDDYPKTPGIHRYGLGIYDVKGR